MAMNEDCHDRTEAESGTKCKTVMIHQLTMTRSLTGELTGSRSQQRRSGGSSSPRSSSSSFHCGVRRVNVSLGRRLQYLADGVTRGQTALDG